MTMVSDAPARGSHAVAAPRRPRVLLLAGATAVAIGTALCFYTRSDMWLDEALTVNIARLPLGELRGALERDGAPPLFYVLLHGWTNVFGDGDIAARTLSGCFAVGTVVACWFAARRFFGTGVAWLTVIVVATNPFLIRYATEARMYALEMFLVACGIIVVARALDEPALVPLLLVGLVTAALVYTQYWGFYLVAVVLATLGFVAWRDRTRRRAALLVIAALGAGLLCFVPWLPTFLAQSAHTGTPWGDPVLPGMPLGETVLGFSGGFEQEGWALSLLLLPLLLLGVFARTVDARHLDVDLRAQPDARWLAFIGGATLVVGLTLNFLAGQAFQPRYSAFVFPFFALLVGRGLSLFGDLRVRAGVVAAVVAVGLVGGLRSTIEQRTQAGQVSAMLRADARPDDLIVYCPDQLGPAVHRLLPDGLRETTYPAFGSPVFVDWTDYQQRLDAADPRAFAAEAVRRAGPNTIWLVTSPSYQTHRGACEVVSDELARVRARTQRVAPSEDYFEQPGLQQFAAPAQ
jgi:mannosyltransferase